MTKIHQKWSKTRQMVEKLVLSDNLSKSLKLLFDIFGTGCRLIIIQKESKIAEERQKYMPYGQNLSKIIQNTSKTFKSSPKMAEKK